MGSAEKTAITPYKLMEKNNSQGEFMEVTPKVQQKSSEAKPLEDNLRAEADRYLDKFYQELYALLSPDAEEELSCYYSVHATVDYIYRAVVLDEQPLDADTPKSLQWILQQLLCDSGFLHAETRDEKKSPSAVSFRENYFNRREHFDIALLDQDRRIDYAMALGIRKVQGPSSWTEIFDRVQKAINSSCPVNETSASARAAIQITNLYRQTAEKLQWSAKELLSHIRDILRTAANLREEALANALKAPFPPEQLFVEFEESVFEDFQNADSVFDDIAYVYCEGRKAYRREIKQLKTKTSSVEQYEMYQQRKTVDFTPFLEKGNWAAYREDMRQQGVDTRDKDHVNGQINLKEYVGRVPSDKLPAFCAIVEKYYKEWYRICRGETYQKPKAFQKRLRLIHAFALTEDILSVVVEGHNVYPVPLIVYELLVSPEDFQNVYIDLSTLCQERPLEAFSHLPELQLLQIRFFMI